jgi:uncharacterized membrane protein YccC
METQQTHNKSSGNLHSESQDVQSELENLRYLNFLNTLKDDTKWRATLFQQNDKQIQQNELIIKELQKLRETIANASQDGYEEKDKERDSPKYSQENLDEEESEETESDDDEEEEEEEYHDYVPPNKRKKKK